MDSALSALKALPPLADFFLPTPEAYSALISCFQYFPVFSILQWISSYHPAGKTSVKSSPLNLPGRLAWFMMEIISPLNLLFILYKLPPMVNIASLPLSNKLAAAMFLIHYANRAIISPWFAPSMSPIHFLVASFAMVFNWFNSSSIAAWLVGYHVPVVQGYKTDGAAVGPSTATAFHGHPPPPLSARILPVLGFGLFVVGMAGNIYSERAFFRLRREEADKRAAGREKKEDGSKAEGNKYSKVYVIPPGQGVFRSILYPHYVFEWIEWLGFALLGTAVFPSRQHIISSTYATPPVSLAPWLVPMAWMAEKLSVPFPLPAVIFVVNAVANMLPHARWGRVWYVEKFGERAVAGRGAVVPFCPWM